MDRSHYREWIAHSLAAFMGIIIYLVGFSLVSYSVLAILVIVTLTRAASELKHRKISVDFLMGIAGAVIIYYGYILEGLVIMLLYGIAELIEEIASRYAVRKMENLAKLIPIYSVIVKEESLDKILTSELKPGDIVLVRKGEAVPADGILLDGGVFNSNMITGESEPIVLTPASRVTSGYVNVGNPVKVKLLKDSSSSTLQRMIDQALKAMEAKSEVQRTIERIAPILTLSVIGGFLITLHALGPVRALPILLAGCPSAFIVVSGYSTAMSIAMMARSGVIVRGGKALEAAYRIRVIAFDKTGTLTLGGLRVAYYMSPKNMDNETFLTLVSSAASSSNHPVAQALSSIATNKITPDKVKEHTSLGIEAVFKDYRLVMGSDKLVKKKNPNIGIDDVVKCKERGYKSLYVLINGELGYLCLEEKIDMKSKKIVRELVNSGYKVVILSGDKEDKVKRVASELGIREYYYEMSPNDKLELVKQLKLKYGNTAMIGDGINDLAALAVADLGVSVGNLEAVSSVADISLTNGVESLKTVFSRARKYVHSLYAGIAAALLIKTSIITLGIIGKIPLITAVLIGDDGSTVISVVTSTLILLNRSS